ncbi:14281_t:CDS:2 [Dentiscutata erythropus]|uniref:14281_t:CDS:1 n=1 Tax=Dentiscutata erythropus TaxID=1348616 RepID=A0A9N9HV51_9GLOM|nr:14281_t:CDS:2 [Dentiscutata erythropus]
MHLNYLENKDETIEDKIIENKIIEDKIIELPENKITEELLQVESMNKVTTAPRIVKINHSKALYTGMSRTTAWRKIQKARVSSNVEILPNLSHLFPAANLVKRLQLLQSFSMVLLSNTLSLVNPT